MPKWLNEWRLLKGAFNDPATVVESFECDCRPDSPAHERMVRGLLTNANRDEYYLRDGVELGETRLPTGQ